LLVKPVVTEGADSVDIYLADDEKYYDYFDYTIYEGAGKKHTVRAPLEKIPLLMQGGNIIPRKDRPRRSSGLMKCDPYTLVVVLDKNGRAEGTLYVDDGETFDYQKGAYIYRRFAFSESSLSSENIGTDGPKTAEYLRTMAEAWIEKIVVIGAPSEWKRKSSVLILDEDSKSGVRAGLNFHTHKDGRASYAVIKNPHVLIVKSLEIDFA